METPVKSATETTPADGVFKVRNGTNDVKLLQVRKDMRGEYRRYTEDGGKKITFLKV